MKGIITRRCELNDNIKKITDLIVGTDDYIYPPMFREFPEEKYTFFASCLNDESSLFYYKNIVLAIQNESIVGISVILHGSVSLCENINLKNYRCEKDIDYCNKHYFKLLFDEYKQKADTVYLSNFCVDPSVRGCGIGKKLLEDSFHFYKGIWELDVLCDNPVAIHLYKKCGFSVLYSEDAFAFEDIPNFRSYRMRKDK